MKSLSFSRRYKDPTQKREWAQLVKIKLPFGKYDGFAVRNAITDVIEDAGIKPYHLCAPNISQFIGDILREPLYSTREPVIRDGSVNGQPETLRFRVSSPLFRRPLFIVEKYNIIHEINKITSP